MNIKVIGIDTLNKALRNIPDVAREAAEKELKLIVADLGAKARQLAPVDTGDLRGSEFDEAEGLEGTVGFTSPYALKQHEELAYNHPRGGQAKYLEQPYQENVDRYIKDIGGAVAKAVSNP